MTLNFNRVRAVVKLHVFAKFHQAECSGSLVIVLTEEKTPAKTMQSVATARTVKTLKAKPVIVLRTIAAPELSDVTCA